MYVIYKYPIPPVTKFYINIPLDAKVLSVQAQIQSDRPQVWVLLNPDLPKQERHFICLATGQETENINNFTKFIGTFQLTNGLVFHLFELLEQ